MAFVVCRLSPSMPLLVPAGLNATLGPTAAHFPNDGDHPVLPRKAVTGRREGYTVPSDCAPSGLICTMRLDTGTYSAAP